VTHNELCRAELVVFAVRAAGKGASLETMKAICYAMRNRVRAGWHNGDWLSNIEEAGLYEGNVPQEPVKLQATDRNLQRLMREIDDIYYGQQAQPDGWSGGYEGGYTGAKIVAPILTMERSMGEQGKGAEKQGALMYWARIDQPMTEWFKEHVIAKNPGPRMQLGMLAFWE
jgi:hypothetical protein